MPAGGCVMGRLAAVTEQCEAVTGATVRGRKRMINRRSIVTSVVLAATCYIIYIFYFHNVTDLQELGDECRLQERAAIVAELKRRTCNTADSKIAAVIPIMLKLKCSPGEFIEVFNSANRRWLWNDSGNTEGGASYLKPQNKILVTLTTPENFFLCFNSAFIELDTNVQPKDFRMLPRSSL